MSFLVLQHTKLGAGRFPFAFPRVELKLKFVVSTWSTDFYWLCTHKFTRCLPELMLAIIRGTNREPVTVWGVGVRYMECRGSSMHLTPTTVGKLSPAVHG